MSGRFDGAEVLVAGGTGVLGRATSAAQIEGRLIDGVIGPARRGGGPCGLEGGRRSVCRSA